MTNYALYRFLFILRLGGHSTFFGLLNTFVHIVMYSYYLFSALGEKYQKFLWWKKYLTALQMVCTFHLLFFRCDALFPYIFQSRSIHHPFLSLALITNFECCTDQWFLPFFIALLNQVQFVLIMVHAFQLLFIDCNYPRAFVWWIGMY